MHLWKRIQILLKQCSGACKGHQSMPLAMSGGKNSCSVLYSHWRDAVRVWLRERLQIRPVCRILWCKRTRKPPIDNVQILRRRPNKTLHFHIRVLWSSLHWLRHYHTIPLSAHMDRVKPPTCTEDRSSTAGYRRQQSQQEGCLSNCPTSHQPRASASQADQIP